MRCAAVVVTAARTDAARPGSTNPPLLAGAAAQTRTPAKPPATIGPHDATTQSQRLVNSRSDGSEEAPSRRFHVRFDRFE